MISLLLAAALQTTPLPEIRTEDLGGGRLRFVVAEVFPLSQLDAMQARMKEIAAAKCGKLALRWGKFTSDTVQQTAGAREVRWANYKQDLSCYDPATDPYKPVAADWRPTPQDDTDALTHITRYLAAMDRGDVPGVVAMLEPYLEMTNAEMAPYVADFSARAVPQGRVIEPLRWAANPDKSAHPGAYAFANVTGPRFCAYVIVYRVGPGRYQVSRQDLLGVKPGQAFSAESEAAMRKQCAEF